MPPIVTQTVRTDNVVLLCEKEARKKSFSLPRAGAEVLKR